MSSAPDPFPLSFSLPVNVSSTSGLSQAAVIAAGGEGNVFVAWEERALELLLVSRSTDSGATFATARPVVPGGEDLSFGQIRMLSPSSTDLQMAFTAFDTYYGGAEIVYAGSSDAAQTFPVVTVVSKLDEINSYAPDIATGWGIAVVWSNSNLSTGTTSVEFSVSADQGATFTPPRRLDTALAYAMCPAVAVSGDGAALAAWIQNDDPYGNDNGSDIFFAMSSDSGATFSMPVNISNNDEKSWCPRLAVDETGTIYVVWTEGNAFVDMRLFFTISTDGGKSFAAPRVLAGPAGSMSPSIAVTKTGALWIAWMSGGNTEPFRSFAIRSLDRGLTFSAPAAIPGGYEIASVASNEVFAAWHEVPQGGEWSDVFASRGIVILCGDANADGRLTASDALYVLRVAVGIGTCAPAVCDFNGSGAISASDALQVLRAAVGNAVVPHCPLQ